MMTITSTLVGFATWTILAETSDTVRATVTQDREVYTVRDARGHLLGRYPTAQQALGSIAR
jgi:hypothetical protein